MSRDLVILALASGIPFSVWEHEEPSTVATALELIDERAQANE